MRAILRGWQTWTATGCFLSVLLAASVAAWAQENYPPRQLPPPSTPPVPGNRTPATRPLPGPSATGETNANSGRDRDQNESTERNREGAAESKTRDDRALQKTAATAPTAPVEPPKFDPFAKEIHYRVLNEKVERLGPEELPPLPWEKHCIQFSLAHVSEGPGYEEGFSTIGLLLPVHIPRPDSLILVDGRGMIDNSGRLGANVGFVFRQYFCDWDRILGANFYYDNRDTAGRFYHQIGFGFESLGSLYDFRANVYIPISQNSRLTDEFIVPEQFAVQIPPNPLAGIPPILTPTAFRRTQFFEETLAGGDFDLGIPIFRKPRYQLFGHAGMYFYKTEDAEDAIGVQTRLELHLYDNFRMHVGYQSDSFFGDHIIAGISFTAPGYNLRRRVRGCCQIDRLTDPIERRQQIVLDRYVVSDLLPAGP